MTPTPEAAERARQLWWQLQMTYPENRDGEHEEQDLGLIEAAIRAAEQAAAARAREEAFAEVLKRLPNLRELTPEESEIAALVAPSVPVSDERIQEIVDYATRRRGPTEGERQKCT